MPLGEVRPHSPELLRDLGRVVAGVDLALAQFDHPAAHRAFHWDLATGVATCRGRVSRIGDADLRRTVEGLLDDIETGLAPLLPRLPKSVIHGDANDYNVIVGAPAGEARVRRVAGLIDFGDMVHSYTVGGLAVAIAYAILDKVDPMAHGRGSCRRVSRGTTAGRRRDRGDSRSGAAASLPERVHRRDAGRRAAG